MEILTYKKSQGFIVKLRGELDAQTAEGVEKVLDEIIRLGPDQVRIDCQDLRYISSRGLGVFVGRFQEIQDKNIRFSLFNMRPSIQNVFRKLGLDEIMTIDPGIPSLH
ncbi:MAG: STAS domain-containing protein [Adhaeribacter sp.]